jgi:hypothetical protein
VRPLRTGQLDPHAAVLHRLREVAPERRPRLVGLPAVIEQQAPEQLAESRFDVDLPVRQDAPLWLSHVGDTLIKHRRTVRPKVV